MAIPFVPVDRMLERLALAREDSDTAYFYDLLHLGEMLTKITTAGLLAAVADDRERSRYRQVHRLLRASGIGEWVSVIDEVLSGPTAQSLSDSLGGERRDLMQKSAPGTWQYNAVAKLEACRMRVDPNSESVPAKIDARRWFHTFARIRNKSRGHGALPLGVCSDAAPDLWEAIQIVIENFSLLQRPWAYLHQNLSGKYRVVRVGGDVSQFEYLKKPDGRRSSLTAGLYLLANEPSQVELIRSDVDLSDFYFANGGFSGKRCEFLSYTTGDKIDVDASPYLTPATQLPGSETEGVGTLELQHKSFGNLPLRPEGYIRRPDLEKELRDVLTDSRHPVVTLIGRGGIGKTSLALTVLHELTAEGTFFAIIWFSARDIDLLPHGPKLVTPRVLTADDISKEFVQLLEPAERREKQFRAATYFEETLTASPLGGPILFVFDNFETVQNPVDIFNWVNTLIRLPNKVLITTRFREFKGDYPVEVSGMTEDESYLLIDATARSLNVARLITEGYKESLYEESDGHPYVIKILLGEVAKAGKPLKVERIVATQEEILNALFERTYSGLSPAAKRVFLTLCNWRSMVPKLAIEAVLLRPANHRLDVDAAVMELVRSSFIEITPGPEENEEFISVPLVAAVFGRSKLTVSPMKGAIEADTELLHAFGAAQQADVRHGLAPRVERLFRSLASRVANGEEQLADHLPMLEFIARKYPAAWILLSSLHREAGTADDMRKAKTAIRRFLEASKSPGEQRDAWIRMATLCRETGDWQGEIHALVELAGTPGASYSDISHAAGRLSGALSQQRLSIDSDEKRIIVGKLIRLMEERVGEGDATDQSRLAWLYLHLDQEGRAREATRRGLALDPTNEFCIRLAARLQVGPLA